MESFEDIQLLLLIQKPHVCSICTSQFREKSGLYNHMHIHAMRPHRCKYCKKSFRSWLSFRKHMSLYRHQLICEPYVCLYCSRTFPSYANLKNHLRKHELECEICNEKFLVMALLQQHYIRKHPYVPFPTSQNYYNQISEYNRRRNDSQTR